jgi:hypothetical protein
MGALIVFDLTDIDSFKDVEEWLTKFQEYSEKYA